MIYIFSAVKKGLYGQKKLLLYGLISAFVTLLDVAVSYVGEHFTDKLISNALGVITGFIVQYFLASKKVFNSRNRKTFLIFLVTFLFGLACAQGIVWFSRDILFQGSAAPVAFAVSKGLSIVIPFFILYYLRLKLIGKEVAVHE
jgi:putative flippase GtrA